MEIGAMEVIWGRARLRGGMEEGRKSGPREQKGEDLGSSLGRLSTASATALSRPALLLFRSSASSSSRRCRSSGQRKVEEKQKVCFSFKLCENSLGVDARQLPEEMGGWEAGGVGPVQPTGVA